jgi:UDP-glucose:(heptosyl)LPS alpha-1,3-glucosyltransferase
MNAERQKPRLAVISPFLDKRHGSERIMVEWLTHLPGEFEVHIYSERVEDLEPLKFRWHRIPKLPGPHLFSFLWWVAAVRLSIGWDRRLGSLQHDLVFSSGANYAGADVVCVHIIFADYVRQIETHLRLTRNPVWHWPRILHRRLYYAVVSSMERRCYTSSQTTLVANSQKTAGELTRFYGRRDKIPILYLGLDHSLFSPEKRAALREAARRTLELPAGQFVLLLVGNDWRNKGVPVLLEALAKLPGLPICLYVVSREDPSSCWTLVKERHLKNRVRFLPPRDDVEFYYAAADAYVGPSLQDSYAMPPAEAMACGLPVIVSAAAGVSEIVADGVDGLILNDPNDASALAAMIQRLYEDDDFRERLAEKAAASTRQYTWERNGQDLALIFDEILRRKSVLAAEKIAQSE